MSHVHAADSAISYLFVPASRAERYEKALASAADEVIIDLEDAVAPEEKDAALAHLLAGLGAGLSRPVHVRINAADSNWFERDLAALRGLSAAARAAVSGVVVPKAEGAETIAGVREAVGADARIIALIETAAGVARAERIAAAPGLSRFAVGAADLSFDLDADINSATIDWVYARLVIESRLAGLAAPIASPPFEIRDLETVRREAVRLRGLGATAQLCIHPGQVAPIHEGFLPDAERIAWARRVVAAGEGGAAQVDGQMVDRPVRERAERILARAARTLPS